MNVAEIVDDNTLVIEREFNTSQKRLYEAWTNPEILQRWWGPEGVTIPKFELDVKEGGSWVTTMYSDSMGERVVSGKYVKLEPFSRLVLTWGWTDNGVRGKETEIEVVFLQTGDKTLMTLTQKVFDDVENRNLHGIGWNSSFNKLEGLFA